MKALEDQEVRRHRLRLGRHEYRRALFHRCRIDVLELGNCPDLGKKSAGSRRKDIYYQARSLFLRHRDADGIYFQGGKLRILDIIEPLEQDLGVPVIHPGVTQCWEIQKRLRVRQPMSKAMGGCSRKCHKFDGRLPLLNCGGHSVGKILFPLSSSSRIIALVGQIFAVSRVFRRCRLWDR